MVAFRNFVNAPKKGHVGTTRGDEPERRTTCGFLSYHIGVPEDVSVMNTYLLTPWNRVLLEKLTGSAASQEIPPQFMEPESSSPYSQVPAICPYPEPTPSSLHPLPLPEDPS